MGKYIIEIDDEVLEDIKKSNTIKEHLNKVDWSIRNATPYKPIGDLISREALKEAVKNHFDNSEYFPFHFLALIDNAQPVDAIVNTIEVRPKGEWIITEELKGAGGIVYRTRKCNICGWENNLLIPRNYCPNCGADMRGEEE